MLQAGHGDDNPTCSSPVAAESCDIFPLAWWCSRPGHRLLQGNKLDLARAQLFLEGRRRVALLLLISQRLSAGIILCWLCGVWSRRVGGCEPHGSCFAHPQALLWRAGAALLQPGAGSIMPGMGRAKGREGQGPGLRWPLWHLAVVWLLIATCLPLSMASVKGMDCGADTLLLLQVPSG